jgi:hypothetical protein
MNRKLALIGIVPLLALAAWTPGCKSKKSDRPATEHDVAPAVQSVDEDAVAIVKRAAHFLRDAKSFEVKTVMGFDVVQQNGQKIEFGSTRRSVIQRPNRARFEWDRRDGKSGVVVFDGNDIWAYSPTHEVYAHTPQPGGIDDAIALITEDLGITAPLADLFTSDVGKSLADGLTDCYIVDASSIGGTPCDHVAVRNEYADYQMWIAQGEQPLLKRIVITYREEEGEPQFWADLTEWNMSPDTNSKAFVFQPPEGAERILFNSIRPQGEE